MILDHVTPAHFGTDLNTTSMSGEHNNNNSNNNSGEERHSMETLGARTRPLRARRRSAEESGEMGMKKRQHGEIVCLGGARRKRLLPDNMAASLALELHKYHYFIRISEEEGREEGVVHLPGQWAYYAKNSELYLTVVPLHERPYPWSLDQEPFRSCGLPPSIWKTGNPGYRARLEIRNMYIHYCHNEDFRRFIDEENPSTAKALKYVREHRLQGTLVRGNYEASEERKMLLLSRVKKFNCDEGFQARKKELAQRKSIMNLPPSSRTPTCSQLYGTIETILKADASRVTKMLGEYQLPSRGGTRGRKLRLVYHLLDMYKDIVNQSSSDDAIPAIIAQGQSEGDESFLDNMEIPSTLQFYSPGHALMPGLDAATGGYIFKPSMSPPDMEYPGVQYMPPAHGRRQLSAESSTGVASGQRGSAVQRGAPMAAKHADDVFRFSFAAKSNSQSSAGEGYYGATGEGSGSSPAPREVDDESVGGESEPEEEEFTFTPDPRDIPAPDKRGRHPQSSSTPATQSRLGPSFGERRASITASNPPFTGGREIEDSWGASDFEGLFDALHSEVDEASRDASRDRIMAAQRAHYQQQQQLQQAQASSSSRRAASTSSSESISKRQRT